MICGCGRRKRSRRNRKKEATSLKRLICIIVLAGMLLSGCAVVDVGLHKSETVAVETTYAEPRPDRQVKEGFGLVYVPEYGFNPYDCLCITNRPVLSLVYESLFVIGPTFQPEPVLCDRFAVSEDEKTYVITLLPGVTFSDGSPLTADDVVASLRAAMDSDYYGSRFSKVASITAEAEDKLIINLTTAYEDLPLLLDVPIVKSGTQTSPRPLGTGPYIFDARQDEEGKLLSLSLRRNESWWQQKLPPVDYQQITLTAAERPSLIRDSFEFGDTSLICADLNAPASVGYRCDYELWDCPTTIMQYLGFNLGAGMFSSHTLRSAVTWIIDRDSICSSIYKGFAVPACLPCAPGSPFYDQELAAGYAYNEGAFLGAMSEVNVDENYVGSILVCSSDPSRTELAYRIVQALEPYGLKLEVRAVDRETYLKRLQGGLFDMYIGEVRLSGNFDLTEFFKPYGALGYGGTQSGNLEQLCYASLENSGNAYDLNKAVMDGGYICPILFKSYAVMASRGVISNLQPAVDCVFHLSGGRTLADASATYEELTSDPDAPEDPGEEEDQENTTEEDVP